MTAPKGVDPGSYPISATTSYLWDDGTRNGSASGRTTVLVVAPLPIGSSQLGDDAWTSAGNGWGPVDRKQSNGEQAAGDGTPLTIRGASFAKDVGAHADSEVVYYTGQACSTATTMVSVDDEVGDSHGNVVVFQLWADDHKVADSGPVSPSDAARTLTADVSGASFVRLVVNKGNDGMSFDHADRADALITCS